MLVKPQSYLYTVQSSMNEKDSRIELSEGPDLISKLDLYDDGDGEEEVTSNSDPEDRPCSSKSKSVQPQTSRAPSLQSRPPTRVAATTSSSAGKVKCYHTTLSMKVEKNWPRGVMVVLH